MLFQQHFQTCGFVLQSQKVEQTIILIKLFPLIPTFSTLLIRLRLHF